MTIRPITHVSLSADTLQILPKPKNVQKTQLATRRTQLHVLPNVLLPHRDAVCRDSTMITNLTNASTAFRHTTLLHLTRSARNVLQVNTRDLRQRSALAVLREAKSTTTKQDVCQKQLQSLRDHHHCSTSLRQLTSSVFLVSTGTLY